MSKIMRNGDLSNVGVRPRAAIALGLIGFISLTITWPLRSAQAGDFVLIHNVKTSTESVSHADLKDIAIGRKKAWSSGVPVQLVLEPPGTPEMQWFAMLTAGVSAETLASKIKQEVFKGELRRPVTVTSDKDCVSAVGNDPGAIGVVSAETAKSLPNGVTVLGVQ